MNNVLGDSLVLRHYDIPLKQYLQLNEKYYTNYDRGE